jgi:hypothetical protein
MSGSEEITSDRDRDSTIDPSSLLRLARTFLGAATAGPSSSSSGTGGSTAPEWEEAGCAVWDAAADPFLASLLDDSGVLPMLVELAKVLLSRGEWRGAELSVGALAAAACHRHLAATFALHSGLVELAVGAVEGVDDAAVVQESLRLVAAVLSLLEREDATAEEVKCAAAWLERAGKEDFLKRLAFVVDNTLRPGVMETALDVASRLLAAAARAPPNGAPMPARMAAAGLRDAVRGVLESWREQTEADGGDAFEEEGNPSANPGVSSVAAALAAGLDEKLKDPL